MTVSRICLPKALYERISRWAEEAYPLEGCGLITGRFAKDGRKEAVGFVPLKNILIEVKHAASSAAASDPRLSTLPAERVDQPERGFAFDPAEYNRAVMKAEGEGLDVIGILHTHPDHPPRPSPIDASQPFLAQWSNIIVSVEKGTTRDMKSWFRETDDKPFDEEPLDIAE